MSAPAHRPARWIRSEVMDWIADQIAARDGERPEVDTNDLTLLPVGEVCRMTGLGRSAIYALVAHGGFPPQVHLTLRRSVRDR